MNQWGRDGNFPSSGSRSSGGAGIVIAALVALLLGAGGGYTGARLTSGVSSGDIAARDTRIADLERQISDLKFQNAGNSDQENDLRKRVEELTKANETLKALADEQGTQADADARAEIAALKKTIEEAGDLRTELGRTRRSLQVSELQLIELEGTVKDQREQIDKLRASLSDAATQGNAGDKALRDQIKSLETTLADVRKQASAVAGLQKRVATLESDLEQTTADLDGARKITASLQKEREKAQGEVSRLTRELDAARAASKDKGGESEALQKELVAAEEQLAARDGTVSTLEARLASLRQELDEAKAKASRADMERIAAGMSLGAARRDKEKLEAEVAVLKQTIASLEDARREEQSRPDVPAGNDDDTASRRAANDVRDALEDMPGYDRLTPDKQIELARRLEDGECVADALKVTLGRVPAIALRNLIRDLGSKC